MNAFARYAAALFFGAAALVRYTPAAAQTVVVQPQPPQQPAPPQAPTTVVNPPAQPTPASPPVIVNSAPSAEPTSPYVANAGSDQGTRYYTRPNRTLLMTGLLLFGVPYVASISVAATSPHAGDGNLWVPALGPWLDLGARGGCPADGDCGAESGNKVLLVADGILQTIGVLELAGAFVFPETYHTVSFAIDHSGRSIAVTPSKLGRDGYGLAAVGVF